MTSQQRLLKAVDIFPTDSVEKYIGVRNRANDIRVIKLLKVINFSLFAIFDRHFEGALNEFEPDIVVYNAGTDILDGDPLGNLNISPQVT